jgi:uncharacterized protein involved in exopolysaccharide biosynthesis
MSRYVELLQKGNHEEAWWTASNGLPVTGEHRRLRGRSVLQLPGAHEEDTNKADWLHGLTALRKHWRQSVIFAASVMLAVVLMTMLTKPVYTPTARVEIDPPGAELFSLEGRGGPESAPDYLETQARNMQSDHLLIGVMRQLQLDQLPEFTRKGLVSRTISAALSLVGAVPTRLWGKDSNPQAANPSQEQVLSAGEASTLRTMQEKLSVGRATPRAGWST